MILLADLAIIFGLAVGVILVCNRLKIPSLVGLLITGTVVGPYGLGVIGDPHAVEVLAEIGIVLLLFVIGMEFSLERLAEIRSVIFFGGTLQVGFTAGIITVIGYSIGRSIGQSFFFGSLVALSSTAIVIKLIQSNALLSRDHGITSLGVLIYQDIIIVPFLLLVPVLAGQTPNFTRDALLRGGLGIMAAVTIILLARWVVPRFLEFIVGLQDREILLMTVVFLVLAIGWMTYSVGLSLSLGAFVSGLIVSESKHTHHVLENILPFRDVFTGLFFVSVGMSLNLETLLFQPLVVGGFTLGVLLLKTLVAGGAILLLGYGLSTALMVGVMLNQIGEFSLLLAMVGLNHGLLSSSEHQIFLAVAVLTMLITPFEFTFARSFESSDTETEPSPDRKGLTNLERPLEDHLIIVGYGHVGASATREIEALDEPYVIVELNPLTVEQEREHGRPIIYGDATERAVLEEAGIAKARGVLVTAGDATSVVEVARMVRVLRPDVALLARIRYLRQADSLKEIGADTIVTDEDAVVSSVLDSIDQLFDKSESRSTDDPNQLEMY